MSRIDTQSPFDQSRQTNHRSVWLTACLAALAIAGLGYLLFAGFGHEPWFPQSLRGLLAEHQDWIFLAGGVALCVLIALLLYRTKAFAGSAQATDGWPSSPDVSVRRKPGPVRQVGKNSARITVPVVLRRKRRICHGDLILTDKRLYFVCYHDESLTKSVGGKAVAHQFGLLGALVLALVSRPGSKRRTREIDRQREQVVGLSLDAQVERSHNSLVLTSEEIRSFSKKALTGAILQTSDEKIEFTEIEKSALPAITSWFKAHGIETSGF